MSLSVQVRGQGAPLVLLHGWAMHGGIFAPLVDRLGAEFELHLVDLPGHGRSAGSGVPLKLDAAARAVADVVPERALWGGWSLGGLVALHAAVTMPARVRGLAMIAASPRFVRADDWAEGMSADVFRSFGEHLRTDYRGTLDRFMALEAQLLAHGEPSADVLCDGLELLETADLRAALPALAMPSLWIAGRRDRLVNPAAMRHAADTAPGGRFHQVQSGGHAPFLTHAGDVADAIAAFAAACPP